MDYKLVKRRYQAGLTPLIVLVVLTAASAAVVGGGHLLKSLLDKGYLNFDLGNLNNLVYSQSDYLNNKKVDSSTFDSSVVGTVVLSDGSYSAYRFLDGEVKDNGESFSGEVKIEFLSGDTGLGIYSDGAIVPFYLTDGTKTFGVVMNRMVANLVYEGSHAYGDGSSQNSSYAIKILQGNVSKGRLVGSFVGQTYETGYIIAGNVDDSGHISEVSVTTGAARATEAETAIAKNALTLFKKIALVENPKVLAANTASYQISGFNQPVFDSKTGRWSLSTSSGSGPTAASQSVANYLQQLSQTGASGVQTGIQNNGNSQITASLSPLSSTIYQYLPVYLQSPTSATTIISGIKDIKSVTTGLKVSTSDGVATLSVDFPASTTTTTTTVNVLDNSVTSSKIADGAVTDSKLSSITTANKVLGSAVQVSANGGLINNSGLSLLTTCSNGQILKWSGIAWVCAANSGGGGSSVWGEITGTLSSQTDLQTALNAKANSSSLGTAAYTSASDYLTPTGSAAGLTSFPTLNQNTTGTASNITGVLGASSFPALTGNVTNTQGSLTTTVSGLTVSNFTSNNISQWNNNSGYITGISWGGVSGTLSNQTDLQTVLNAKANTSSLGTISSQNSNNVSITGGSLSGLTSVGATTFTGNLTGNATGLSAILVSTSGGSGINNAGTLTWGTGGTLGTAAYTAASAYATAAQGTLATNALPTTSFTDAAVSGKLITGYVSGAGTVAATDSILQAIQKLNGNDATNANLTGVITSVGNATSIANGAITNAMLANSAVANLSGTNTGDNAINSNYSSDYRAANFIAGTNYLTPTGSAASLTSFPTLNQSTTGTAAGLSVVLASTSGGSGVNNAGTLTWGSGGTLGTAAYTAASAYATTAQGTLATNALPSVSFTDAGVSGKLITGYVSGAGTIAATDSLLQAIQKLNGNDATNANLTGVVTSVGNATSIAAGAITNAMLFNSAVANLSGTNTGDNAANSNYASDYRAANFVAGTNYLTPTGSAASLTSFPTFNQSTTGNALTATTATTATTGNALANTDAAGQSAITAINSATTGTINIARLNSTVTTQGNTFNGISQLVKLDTSGNLPALNASALTGITGDQVLPTQTGNNGKVLGTNGTTVSWVTNSSGVAWGAITGTLSDQTDLQTALNAKANSSSLGTISTQNANAVSITGGTLSGLTSVGATTFTGALTGNASTVTGFSITGGKTLSVSKTMTLTSADDTGVYTFPTGTATLLATNGSAAGLTSFPTLNQNTTGIAAGLSAVLTSTSGGSGINNSGTLTWGTGGTLGTAAYTASSTYATAAQGTLASNALPTASFTDAAVSGKLITGYVSGAGTVAATDSILQAIQKLNGNDATNANLTGIVTSVGNATSIAAGAITNAMLANSAVANLSGTNTGDNAANSTYASDYRAANFVAGTNYLAPNGSAASLTSFPTFNQNTTGTAAGLSAVLSSTIGGSGVNNAGTLTWGSGGTLGTAAYTASNTYATAAQGTLAANALPIASFTDSAVSGKLITGYVSGAGTVAATDSILQAIQKLNGNEVLDYDSANFVAGTNYLTPTGSAASLTNFPTLNQSTTGNALTATTATTGNVLANTDAAGQSAITAINSATVGTIGTARLNSTVTIQGNTFNGISQLVKLDTSGNLPAVGGAALTGITGDQVLPTQTGNNGKVLGTNGTTVSWVTNSSGVAWGAITGTLANQTDLNTALSGKLTTSLPSANIFVGNGSGAATGVAMSGDVTIDNTGATTIGATKVTYSKIQNVSATNKILGRATAGAGSIEEITVGGDLSQSGSNFTIGSGAVTLAKMASLTVNSLIGNNTGGSSVPIALTPTQVTTLLGLGTIATQASNNVSITGGSAAGLTGLAIRSSGTGAFDLTINNTENLTAGRTLTVTLGNTARTLTLTGDASITGTNTGDNSANSTYASDYRAANFIAGTNYLAPNGSAASLTSFPTFNQNTTGTAAGLSTILVSTSGGSGINNSGTLTWGTGGTLGTAAYTAASAYATAAQGTLATNALPSASFTDAAVSGKLITGYVSGAGTIAATDTILQAIQKLNGNDATNANLTGVVTSTGNATSIAAGAITNAMLANSAVANLSGTNSGDNAANSTYASDYRAANFVAGTNYLTPSGSAAGLTNFPTLNQNTNGTAAGLSVLLVSTSGGSGINNAGTLTWGSGGTLGTAAYTPSSNYATSAQGTLATNALPSASFTDSAVSGKLITGYVTGAGTVAATDSILQAIQKLNGNEVLDYDSANFVAGTNYLTPSGSAASLTGFPTFNQNTTGTSLNITGVLGASSFPTLTGDVTTTQGNLSTAIASGAVTLSKMANLAANSIIGNNTGLGAVPIALTTAQVKTLLAIANTDVSGFGTMSTQNASGVAITGGTLTGVTGLTFTSGNFDQSASSGTFKTGTGAVALNGATTLASGKALIITGGAGDPATTNGTFWYDTTANKIKIVENGIVKIVCNATDLGCGAGGGGGARLDQITGATGISSIDSTNNAIAWNWSTLTTQTGLTLNSTATSLTTGGVLVLGSSTTAYNHSAGETGSLATLTFTDATTNAVTSTTNGLLVSSTVNATSGTATRTINGINIATTTTACSAGTCTVNGLNVGGISEGSDATRLATTGINVGSGWDTGILLATSGTGVGVQINTTGTGNMLDLNQNGIDKFTVGANGGLVINGSDSSITRTAATDFSPLGTIGSNLINSGGRLQLSDGTPANSGQGTITTTSQPATPSNIGAGAMAISRPDGKYLIINGGATGTTQLYDPVAGTITASQTIVCNGTTTVGIGALALPMSNGKYTIICGGAGSVVGATSVVDPMSNAPSVLGAPLLTNPVTVGGTVAFKRPDGKYLVTVGGGVTTQIFDPVAGTFALGPPDTGLGNWGVGSLALPRPDGTALMVTGGAAATTAIYNPYAVSATIGTFSGAGPSLNGTKAAGSGCEINGLGSVALKRQDGKYVILSKAGAEAVYDPSANTMTCTTGVANVAVLGDGAHAIPLQNGKFMIFTGGGNTSPSAFVYNQDSDTFSSYTGTAPTATNTGAFSLMRTDGTWQVFTGTNTCTNGCTNNFNTNIPMNDPFPIAPLAAAPTSGGSCDNGMHSYYVTFVTNGVESELGQKSNIVNCNSTLTTQTVVLSGIPIGPGGTATTARKIYRTTAGDTGLPKLISSGLCSVSDNTTTSCSDTTADASLGATYSITDASTWYKSEDISNLYISGGSSLRWTAQLEAVFAAARNGVTNTAFKAMQFYVKTAVNSSGCAGPLASAPWQEIQNSGDPIRAVLGANCVKIAVHFNRAMPKKLFDDRGTWIGNGSTVLRYDFTTPTLFDYTIDNSAVFKKTSFDFSTPDSYSVSSTVPTAPTATENAGGGSCTTGAHFYFISYFINGVESLLSPASGSATCNGTDKVNLTNIPLGPSGTTARKIYRTAAAYLVTDTPFYVGQVPDNSTTTYSDTIADTSLGAAFVQLTPSGPVLSRGESTRVESVNNHLTLPYGRITPTTQVATVTGLGLFYMGAFAEHPSLNNATGIGTTVIARDDKTFLVLNGGVAGGAAELYDPATQTFTNQTNTGDKPTATVGSGAFAIKRPDGKFLVVLGGGSAVTNIYDQYAPPGSRFTVGPSVLGTAPSQGAFAILNADSTYTILPGNANTSTSIYDPVRNTMIAGPLQSTGTNMGALAIPLLGANNNTYKVIVGGTLTVIGTVTMNYDANSKRFSAGTALAAGAGAGATAFQRQDGFWILIKAGNTATTSIINPYDGVELAGIVLTTGVNDRGAQIIPRADGTFLIVGGNAADSVATTTQIYFPWGGVWNATVGAAQGIFAVGPTTIATIPALPTSSAPASGGSNACNTGVHFWRYSYVINGVESALSAPSATQTCTVTTLGQESLTNVKIGPTGTTARNIYRTTIAGGVTATSPYFLVGTIADNVTTTYADSVADPTTGKYVGGGVGDGAVSFQRPDGKFVTIFGGATASKTTSIYDAGWYADGQYLSEEIQVPALAANSTLDWQQTPDQFVRMEVRTAGSQTALGAATWNSISSPGGSIGNPAGDTWAQVEVNFRRDFPTFMGNLNGVYNSSGGMAYAYRPISLPTVNSFQITNGMDLMALQTNGLNVLRVTSSGNILSSTNGGFFSGGADLAENYTSAETLEKGDVVAIDPTDTHNVKRSVSQYQSDILGIVSTTPGFVAGGYTEDSYPIALIGRVPVKVSSENGNIEVGDYVTSASIPGYAMKATQAGRVLGKALETFDPANATGCPAQGLGNLSATKCGEIMVFVNLTDYLGSPVELVMAQNQIDGLQNTDSNLDMVSNDQLILSFLEDLKVQKEATGGKLSEIFTDRLSAAFEIITPKLSAGEINIRGKSIFLGDVEFTFVPLFNSDTAGFAVVKQGDNEVTVNFDKEYVSTPVVNASPVWDTDQTTLDVMKQLGTYVLPKQDYIIVNSNTKGFSIILDKPAVTDLKFSWMALAVKGARTVLSASTVATPSASPSVTPVATATPLASPEPTAEAGTPTPSPTASPTTQTLTVLSSELGYVRLRDIPSTDGVELAQVQTGTVLLYTSVDNNWYQIVYNNQTGWISGTYVQVNE